MDYYPSIKRNELLIHTTWMTLKTIMLRERAQAKRSTYCIITYKILENAN